jgi:hypothetical protein
MMAGEVAACCMGLLGRKQEVMATKTVCFQSNENSFPDSQEREIYPKMNRFKY